MKKIFITTFVLLWSIASYAQLYVPGEVLNYRMSYKAKFFPNTEVSKVTMQTSETTLECEPAYKVYCYG